MRNAKEELMKVVWLTKANIKCATVSYDSTFQDPDQIFDLQEGYSKAELNSFLESLDFEYDNGYGCQHLFGTIWLTDGTWLERGEYDGSEWWEHRLCPEIPEKLKTKLKLEI